MNVSFLSIRTQFENLGDALINRELIRLLAARGTLVVDTGIAPDWFVDMLDLPADATRVSGRPRLFLEMVKALLRGDRPYYFFLPGGLFGEFNRLQLAKKALALLPLRVLRLLGVRLCHVGPSFERIGANYITHLRRRRPLLHAFYVRDARSLRLLEHHAVGCDGLLPDLAFNLFDAPSPPLVSTGRRDVCFSFRTDQHAEQFDACMTMVERVAETLSDGARCHIAVQVERDRPGMEAIRDRLQARLGAPVEIFQETRDIARMQAFYRDMGVVVSNRLHVLLLGASVCGRLVACVDEKNQKISGLLETLGRADLVVPMPQATPAAVRAALAAPPLDGRAEQVKLADGFRAIFAEGGTARVGAAHG